MTNAIVCRYLPRAGQALIAIAWLAGAGDALAFSVEHGAGKLGAAVAIFGPLILLATPLMELVRSSPPNKRQWTYVLLLLVFAASCLPALLYTRVAIGS